MRDPPKKGSPEKWIGSWRMGPTRPWQGSVSVVVRIPDPGRLTAPLHWESSGGTSDSLNNQVWLPILWLGRTTGMGLSIHHVGDAHSEWLHMSTVHKASHYDQHLNTTVTDTQTKRSPSADHSPEPVRWIGLVTHHNTLASRCRMQGDK